MKHMIYDETDHRFVNQSEAYGETEEYGKLEDPFRYRGGMDEAEEIAKRLAEETGHIFSLRMWPQ